MNHDEAIEAGFVPVGSANTTDFDAVERKFLAASVAVWRQIDALTQEDGTYLGLDAGHELRVRERAAWEEYRAELDGVHNDGVDDPTMGRMTPDE